MLLGTPKMYPFEQRTSNGGHNITTTNKQTNSIYFIFQASERTYSVIYYSLASNKNETPAFTISQAQRVAPRN